MAHWTDTLREAQELVTQGLMTDLEFDQLRKRLLDSLVQRTDPENPPSLPASGPAAPLSGDTTIGKASSTPRQIGQYFILSKIGQGGMGSVFLGRHQNDMFAAAQGDVAIKLMSPSLSRQHDYRQRFVLEAVLGKKLKHDSVASILELWIDNDRLALVMEYIEGETLQLLIPPTGFDAETALRYLQPLAEVIDYLHSQSIIHRDIKPSNIKITASGTPVLLDLGIAKDTQQDQTMLTQTGTAMGTEQYMAPEQMDAKNITPQADQYAFALIAYELLSGRLPWSKDEPAARITVAKLTDGLVPLPLSGEQGIGLQKVVMKGLALDPRQRFASCLDLVAALEEIIHAPTPEERALQEQRLQEQRRQQQEAAAQQEAEQRLQEQQREQQQQLTRQIELLQQEQQALASQVDLETTRLAAVRQERHKTEPVSLDLPSLLAGLTRNPKRLAYTGMAIAGSGLLLLVVYFVYSWIGEALEQRSLTGRVEQHRQRAAELWVEVPYPPYSSEEVLALEKAIQRQEDLHLELEALQAKASIFGIAQPSLPLRRWTINTLKKQVQETTTVVRRGSFMMGCPQGTSCPSGHTGHRVSISYDFEIMNWEVTQASYLSVTGENPSSFQTCGSSCPVESVSWFDAVRYANRLNKLLGLESCYVLTNQTVTQKGKRCTGWRLPTEAEWEYAARGKDLQYTYAGSDLARTVGVFGDKTLPVCQKKRNGRGICDMSGNVAEWLHNLTFHSYPSSYNKKNSKTVIDPGFSERVWKIQYLSSSYRVSLARGGSFKRARRVFEGRGSYSDDRVALYNHAYVYVGFRLVRRLEEIKGPGPQKSSPAGARNPLPAKKDAKQEKEPKKP